MSTDLYPIGTRVRIEGVDHPEGRVYDLTDLNGQTGVVESYPDMYEQLFQGAPADAHYIQLDETGEIVGLLSSHLTEMTEEVAA